MSRSTSKSGLGSSWLILGLAILGTACSGDAKRDPHGAGGSTAGQAGAAQGGTGGSITGGVGGYAGEEPSFSVVGANRPDPHRIVVEFATSGPIYQWTCSGALALTKSDGSAFRRELPECGTTVPYYLDSTYYPNEWHLSCLGCDVVSCFPFPESWTVSTDEIVRAEAAPIPILGEGGVSGAGGSTGEGGSASETAGAAGSADVPINAQYFQTRTTQGPYWIRAKYFTSPSCSGTELTSDPVLVDVR
ncbi:MAG TPA: hypothetical protein VFQ61_09120 [Polyangiaceae bacterium]|nr:hypothetical protein [Polyangiaceae bacterium]